MLNFFNKPEKLVSPASGKCICIEDVNDKVFSSKIMGDGFAIIPNSNTILAPIAGIIVTAADTKHAVAIRTKKGEDILLHVGVDTVGLNGKGFEMFVKTGDAIRTGDCLFRYDSDFMREKGIDTTVMVIFASENAKNIRGDYFGKTISAGEPLLRLN